MVENDLLVGWKQIAQFLGVSERSIRGYRGLLLEGGRIFYRRRRARQKNCLRLVRRSQAVVQESLRAVGPASRRVETSFGGGRRADC